MAQPNMGRRKLYATRVPQTVASPFDVEVGTSGLSHSQFIADLLAVKYGLRRPSERFRTKRARSTHGMDTLDLAGLPGKIQPQTVDLDRAAAGGEVSFTTYLTRLPEDIVLVLERDAVAAGLSYSHFIATVIADRYGAELPAERFAPKRTLADQEVLPLERAS